MAQILVELFEYFLALWVLLDCLGRKFDTLSDHTVFVIEHGLKEIQFLPVLLPRDQSCDFVADRHLCGSRGDFVVLLNLIPPDFDLSHRVPILNFGPTADIRGLAQLELTLKFVLAHVLDDLYLFMNLKQLLDFSLPFFVNLEQLLDLLMPLLPLIFLLKFRISFSYPARDRILIIIWVTISAGKRIT